MKKILLAGLVAASTVFAQGAMADAAVGVIDKVVSLGGEPIHFGVTLDTSDPSFVDFGDFTTDCATWLGTGAALDDIDGINKETINVLRAAAEAHTPVTILYTVRKHKDDPTGDDLCFIDGVIAQH